MKIQCFSSHKFFNFELWFCKVVCPITNIGIAKIVAKNNNIRDGNKVKKIIYHALFKYLPNVGVVSPIIFWV
jgi:hypothetical protein